HHIDMQTLLYSAPPPPRVAFDPILDVDVAWNEQQAAGLKRRGFELCGHTKASSVWVRRASGRHPRCACNASPIEAVEVVGKESKAAKDSHWVSIPRNLNKGGFTTAAYVIRYRRAAAGLVHGSVRRSKVLLGLRVVDELAEENKALS